MCNTVLNTLQEKWYRLENFELSWPILVPRCLLNTIHRPFVLVFRQSLVQPLFVMPFCPAAGSEAYLRLNCHVLLFPVLKAVPVGFLPRRMSSSLRSQWLTKARTQCGVLRNAIVRGTAWCVKLGNEPGQVTKRNKITSQSVGIWEL